MAAEKNSDVELGNEYVYCGVLGIQINKKGGGDVNSPGNQTGMLMLTLGSSLLGKNTIEEIKPDIEKAKIKLKEDSKDQTKLFKKYVECIATHKKHGSELLAKFKAKQVKKQSNVALGFHSNLAFY